MKSRSRARRWSRYENEKDDLVDSGGCLWSGHGCDGLRENYPYVKLAKRQAGADLDALEENYRIKVEQCANDNTFYETLSDFIREFSYTGHLDLWGRRYESELASLRTYVKESGETEKEPYIEALDNPVSCNTYAAMTAFYQEETRLTEEKRRRKTADGAGSPRKRRRTKKQRRRSRKQCLPMWRRRF